MTKWSEHVKKHAKKHKMSYREASMNSKCKESYRKMSKKRMSPRKMSKKRMSPRKKRGKRKMNAFGGIVQSENYKIEEKTSEEPVKVIEGERNWNVYTYEFEGTQSRDSYEYDLLIEDTTKEAAAAAAAAKDAEEDNVGSNYYIFGIYQKDSEGNPIEETEEGVN